MPYLGHTFSEAGSYDFNLSCFFRFSITTIIRASPNIIGRRLVWLDWRTSAPIVHDGVESARSLQLSCLCILGHSSNVNLQHSTAYRRCDGKIVRISCIVLEICSGTVAAASLRPKRRDAQYS